MGACVRTGLLSDVSSYECLFSQTLRAEKAFPYLVTDFGTRAFEYSAYGTVGLFLASHQSLPI